MNATLTHRSQTMRTFPHLGKNRMQPRYPEGWAEGLTSEEFLSAAKQMLRSKFDDKN